MDYGNEHPKRNHLIIVYDHAAILHLRSVHAAVRASIQAMLRPELPKKKKKEREQVKEKLVEGKPRL